MQKGIKTLYKRQPYSTDWGYDPTVEMQKGIKTRICCAFFVSPNLNMTRP